LFYFAHAAGRAVLLLHEKWHQALRTSTQQSAFDAKLGALRMANTFRIHKAAGELLVPLEFGEVNVDTSSLPPPTEMPELDVIRPQLKMESTQNITECIASYLAELTDVEEDE